MKELFEAIYTSFSTGTNAFKTAIGGRLDYGTAKPSWTDNFAVMQGTGADQQDAFRTSIDEVYFQFNCFSTVRETCFDILAACKSYFDRKVLTVSSHYQATLRRDIQTPPLWNEQDNLWQATIEFRARLQHT